MDISEEFRKKLETVKAKRPATIIAHILQYGSITSKEIKELYGYNHPPRAVRDIRELGIPVEAFRIKDSDGKSIAAYKFGEFEDYKNLISKRAGRTALSKAIKKALIEKFGSKCFIYQEPLDESLLQIDHRIPYEIAGEQGESANAYVLLSPSANRANEREFSVLRSLECMSQQGLFLSEFGTMRRVGDVVLPVKYTAIVSQDPFCDNQVSFVTDRDLRIRMPVDAGRGASVQLPQCDIDGNFAKYSFNLCPGGMVLLEWIGW